MSKIVNDKKYSLKEIVEAQDNLSFLIQQTTDHEHRKEVIDQTLKVIEGIVTLKPEATITVTPFNPNGSNFSAFICNAVVFTVFPDFVSINKARGLQVDGASLSLEETLPRPETIFISELIKNKPNLKVLTLVPTGSPIDRNKHSIQYWDLEAALEHSVLQNYPDDADVLNTQMDFMDCTPAEKVLSNGLIPNSIENSDIVLEWVDDHKWNVSKHPDFDCTGGIELKYDKVSLDDLLSGDSKEVLAYIDNRSSNQSICENIIKLFHDHLNNAFFGKAFLSFVPGKPGPMYTVGKEQIILQVTSGGLLVEKSPGLPYAYRVVTIEEAIGQTLETAVLKEIHSGK